MEFNNVLVRYGEISLKGDNRDFFEKKLVQNIKLNLKKNNVEFKKIKRIRGRIIIEGINDFSILKNVLGIISFSPAIKLNFSSSNLSELKENSIQLMKEQLKEKKFNSFRVSVQRLNKGLSITSMELEKILGSDLLNAFPDLTVNLKKFDFELKIELIESNAFLFLENIKGFGGLPVSCSGKVIALISGGIDSPVAAFLAMKRGCNVIAVHFNSFPFTDERTKRKAIASVKVLSKFQNKINLLIVPFGMVQEQLIKNCERKLNCVLCRRFMLKIASEIALKEKAKAIITGESLGQVASQTLDNLLAEDNAASIPVLRPLIGFDKTEIIKLAESIGSFNESIKPAVCCTLVPKYPATKSKLKYVLIEEKKINFNELIEEIMNKTEKIEIK